MILKRIDVLSAGKVLGAMYALLGLIPAAVIVLFSLLGVSIAGDKMGAISLVMSLVFAVMFPVFYGILGFLSGLLMAAVYNLIASLVGGIEMEFEQPVGHR